jgi:UDP-N-acetylglucosamine 2-epimerase (non-hydrolysing)
MNKIKIGCIFGTRPELIKMAPIIRALKLHSEQFEVETISTGQHRELLIPLIEWFELKIDKNLEVMNPGQSLNELTGRLMSGFGRLLAESRYDLIIGQGDTTSVLTAAFAAFHAKIPFAHIEAGLRTYDRNLPFPEEMNRVLVSRLATLHFAPTERSAENLRKEGVANEIIFMIGNSVIDALQYTISKIGYSKAEKQPLRILVTAHRRENHGEPLHQICSAIRRIALRFPEIVITFPVHPNPQVRSVVFDALKELKNVSLIDPLPYEELVRILDQSYLVLTDSGGLQEEAPALGKPVLVLRKETERPELVELGGSILVGSDADAIYDQTVRLVTDHNYYNSMVLGESPYGDGRTGDALVDILKKTFFI